MPRAIGIDLGTTNSVMAVMTASDPEIIANVEGSKITPSVVAVNPKDGRRLIGDAARRQAIVNPENTIYSAKRFIGRRFDDPTVQSERELVPFEVAAMSNGDAGIYFDGELRWPADISAMVLRKLKEDAEAKLGEKVTQAVITVPAYFGDAQREATRVAGEIAGLEVLRVIPEPTAATLAYGLDKSGELTVAVFDLGGGTFDVSIIQIGDSVMEVLSTVGDMHLGGDDFDQRIVDWLIDGFKQQEGVDLRELGDPGPLERLREEAERVKIHLSSQETVEIGLPFLAGDDNGALNLETTLSRDEYEEMVHDLIERTTRPAEAALEEAGVTIDDIDEVLLVGGMTRTPKVQDHVQNLFGKEPNRTINPDEVVALGAALQVGVLQKEVKDILLVDVIPLGLGINVKGGIMMEIVPRNTNIPAEKTGNVTTVYDGQTAIYVAVHQGQREMADGNTLLGSFTLSGILPAPRGVPSIEIKFIVDTNGILTVTAKDPATGKEEGVVITGRSGISPEEIDRLTKEAEMYAAEDRARREAAESNNDAERLVYDAGNALKTVKERGIPIAEAARNEVLEKRDAVQSLLNAEPVDIEAVRTATADLRRSLMRIGEDVYGRVRSNGA